MARRRSSWRVMVLMVLGCLLTTAGTTLHASPSAEQLEFFETRIRPVLAEHCYKCHSAESGKSKGGLLVDSRGALAKGGDTGSAIADKADASLLIKAISYEDPDLQMPPKNRLPATVVADFKKWIESGAPWPEGGSPAAGKAPAGAVKKFDLAARKQEHWSWQPIKKPAVPQVQQKDWPRDPMDRFILAGLESQGLRPAPPADASALLRRVYFDLTGLPPSVDDLQQFLADKSPNAYEKVVDRLLASPEFGEKWARHWLDVVRYAETYGHEFDYNIPDAWRYRDYVIRALNADVPYDQFVREHIAGDLLPTPRMNKGGGFNESIIATGFWFMYEQTHAPVDSRQHLSDRIDNMVDTMTKAFLGLTVACARCHDHKFDAISTKDYYALAGFLHSTRLQQYWMDNHGQMASAVQQLASLQAEGDKLIASAAASAAASFTPASPTLRDGDVSLVDMSKPLKDFWYLSGWAFADPVQAPRWDAASPEPAVLRPGITTSSTPSSKLRGELRSKTFVLEKPFVHVLVAGKGTVRIVVDLYLMDQHNSLLFKGLIKKVDHKNGLAWVTLGDDLEKYVGHRAYLECVDDSDEALTVAHIIGSTQKTPPALASKEPLAISEPLKNLDPSVREKLDALRQQMNQLEAKLPTLQRVLAAADGNGVDERVYIRGKYQTPGEPAPRAMLEAIDGATQPSFGSDTSGRLQLADRILDPANPYPARVMVNRLWHHLFGRGIVPTVDNFGVLGQAPTHPELLDHLADRFRSDGWSMKRMIRAMVLSSTYRMASKAETQADAKDPQNLFWHRMPIRRLPAESIRDGILSVTGELKRKLGGEPVLIQLTEFHGGRGKPPSGPLDGAGRRSIYLGVRRNFLSPMMLAFDTPIPFQTMGRRNVTNVPAQALILMNDPFILDQAQKWARRILADASLKDVDQRIDRMFLEAYSRPSTPSDRATLRAYLQEQSQAGTSPEDSSELKRWTDVAHILINTKEFTFVN